ILATIANSRTLSLFHAGVRDPAVALTKGFDRAFLIGAGFAIAGALLTAILIRNSDSRQNVEALRREKAAAAAAAG
ncbi:MAG: hypothetical protein JO243_12165, partial [Solirubrobacterales bacterium]|nr:hypothetical protein [Solirubrobacterales bacterium]